MGIITTLEHVYHTQSKVSHGDLLGTAQIIRERCIGVIGFDHVLFFNALERVDRRGWTKRGLYPENDLVHTLDHMLISHKWLKARGLDTESGVMQSLVHEAGEVGKYGADDTLPGERSIDEKVSLERLGVEALIKDCGVDIISGPWEDYISGTTTEAVLVEQLDKLVTLREAARRGVWEEFYEYYLKKGVFIDPEILESARSMKDIQPELALKGTSIKKSPQLLGGLFRFFSQFKTSHRT